jgi:hypothetical protein
MVIHQEFTRSATTANEEQKEILLAPYFLMRVTGLPFSIMEQFQFPHIAAIIEELLSLEKQLEGEREKLLENLKAHFKQVQEKEIQHKGLDLQRAIVSQNGQKAWKLLQVVASSLPENLARTSDEWVRWSLRYAELLALGEPTLQEEITENRKKLRQWFCQENFQQGLLLSSDTLYKELQNYLSVPPEKNNNRLRKAEEGLLSYFVRMATKTSPYSTFCSTSLGTWSNQDQGSDQIRVHTWQQQRYVRFHAGLLATIAHHLAARSEVRPYLYPVLNTTLNRVTESALAPNPGTGTNQADEIEKIEIFTQEKKKESKYIYQEQLVRIRINPLASELITAIEQAAGEHTYQEILEQVVEKLLASEGWHEGPEEKQAQRARYQQKTQGMLEYLAKHSVVAIDLRIPAHEDDKLKFIIQRLAGIPGSWLAGMRAIFEQVHQLMDVYAHSSAQECAQILPAIRDMLLQLCQEIGSQQDPPWDVKKTIEKLYPALILEDSTMPFAALTLEQKNWQPVLRDLQVLQEIAPVLDLGVITKMNMDRWAKEAFAQKPSQTEDLITCHLHFWQEFMGNYELQQKWLRSDPRFIQLRTQQQSFLTLLHKAMQQAQQDKTQVAQLDPQELHNFARQLPDFLRPNTALAHFGQFFFEREQPHMVLNATWTGPGTVFSRFSHLFQYLPVAGGNQGSPKKTTSFVETFRAYITQLGQHHKATYASIAETGDINVNMHAALAPYEILFPMSASQRAKDEQITLRDLHVLFHQQKQEYQIYSQRLNERILPVHMGFSLLQMMPPLYQALVTTTTHYPLFDLITLLESQISSDEKQEIRHYPRITLGHIILNRESWKIPAAMVPQREASETSFDYFLKMNRWRVANDLPLAGFRRIAADASENPPLPGFVKTATQSQEVVADTAEGAANTSDLKEQDKKARLQVAARRIPNTLSKPFYLHFQNYFLVSLLGTITRNLPDQAALSIEEILPMSEQHLLKHDNESYATEFVLEVSRVSEEKDQGGKP